MEFIKDDIRYTLDGKQDTPIMRDFYNYIEHSNFVNKPANLLMDRGKQFEQDYRDYIQQCEINPTAVRAMYGMSYNETLGSLGISVPNPARKARAKGLVQVGQAGYVQDLNELNSIYPS